MREPFYKKAVGGIIKRKRAVIDSCKMTIEKHRQALETETKVGRIRHHTTSIRFRERDIVHCEQVIAIYQAVDSTDAYRAAARLVDELNAAEVATDIEIFRDGYAWSVAEYERRGNMAAAAKERKQLQHWERQRP